MLHTSYLPIPLAAKLMLKVEVNSGHLQKVVFCRRRQPSLAPDETSQQVAAALKHYFESPKDGTVFVALPLAPADTPFRQRVRQRLRAIAPGQTRSYGELLGHNKYAVAVGQACASNPLLIVVPCHRVIAADGSLGGWYSGDFGPELKEYLLELKQHLLKQEDWRPSA